MIHSNEFSHHCAFPFLLPQEFFQLNYLDKYWMDDCKILVGYRQSLSPEEEQ